MYTLVLKSNLKAEKQCFTAIRGSIFQVCCTSDHNSDVIMSWPVVEEILKSSSSVKVPILQNKNP